eukprot:TRINITY_DN31439_c0_g1_i2.p1 TRINITY_DN31439_c0_g1~~TRINITY_DN31439_c0_g1_i2.p1  ORF type:complete len:436 (+),score=68.50 TRINITY_DN31439_c0_g1_i2:64-1308(+)
MQAKDRTHRRSARAARRRVLWSAVGCVAGCVSAGVWRHAFVGCGSSPRLSKGGRKAINEAGFEVGERMSPEQAAALGIKPFGDGGACNVTQPRPKVYTHGPCASPLAAQFVVKARHNRDPSTGAPERKQLLDDALNVLRTHGFVILEELLDSEQVAALEDVARVYLDATHEGFVQQPLRAQRMQLQLPFQQPWASEWLMKNELILNVVSSYVTNNLAGGRTQDEQQWGMVQWITSGAHLDFYKQAEWGPKPGRLWDSPPTGCSDVGSAQEHGPWLGRVMVTKTPPRSPPQKYHRDINFPGPCAQLTIGVPLTQMVANNGPLGYMPGSHRMQFPGYEVVLNPPRGSVVLYDSFVEHRGTENHGPRDRYAMYYEFETRGMFGGYTDDHFGEKAVEHTHLFRQFVDPELRRRVPSFG